MQTVRIEHSKVAYCADFAFYFVVVALMLGVLAGFAPHQALPDVALAVIVGVLCWSLVEYFRQFQVALQHDPDCASALRKPRALTHRFTE